MLLVLVASISLGGLSCGKSGAPQKEKVWTEMELKGLVGRTPEEVKELLGEPKGLYTYRSKGRWHYASMMVVPEGQSVAVRRGVLVYFSQFGEHRCTIVDIVEQWGSVKK